MLGLAVGDAISWPAMFHRSYLLPFWTRRIRREIEAASETTQVIRPALPFSLNRPASAFALGPTDDTEWAAFTAQQLLLSEGKLDAQKLLEAWLELARASQNVRGGVSLQAALANLRQGKLPPRTGRDNPHYFDDGAVCRAVPIGIIFAGQPHAAAEMAAIEASMTNAEDGLWAAQAMAAAISVACVGADLDAVIATAISQLPDNTWIERSVTEALQFCQKDKEVFDILPRLSESIINREYSYGSVAPETFALTLVITKLCRADFKSAVLAAASFAKTADSVPAMVGALTGAMTAQEIASPDWRERLQQLQGICIPTLAGVNYVGLSEQLADLAMRKMQ
jgi:ADP-ribosylglycohydrolase